MRYGFRFLDKEPSNDNDHYWFKLSRILDFDSEDAFDAFRFEERTKLIPGDQPMVQGQIFEKNLHRLYQAMWRKDVISYYTEVDQNYDRVLDIFVRANEGGTKLSKSDLLLAMITSKWSGVNARDEIYGFVDRLNFDLSRKNNFDKDFVMKTCLVLSDLPVQYKVQNFNNQNLALIHSHWEAIKRALETAVNLVNSFGIDRDNLTSANALIPIAYYLLQHPSVTLDGGSSFEVINASRIRTWLLMALLNNVFGGQSDSMLRDIRTVLQEHTAEKDFPLDAINRKIADAGRTAYFDDNAVDQFLAHTYGGQGTTLALTLLYEDNNWGTKKYHQDHIFPRSLFTPTRLTRAGIAVDKQQAYLNAVDYIGNLELLLEHENVKKSNQPFDEWLATRDASFKQRHLIPDDPELYTLDRFLDFIDEREALIKKRLTALFGPVSVGMKRQAAANW